MLICQVCEIVPTARKDEYILISRCAINLTFLYCDPRYYKTKLFPIGESQIKITQNTKIKPRVALLQTSGIIFHLTVEEVKVQTKERSYGQNSLEIQVFSNKLHKKNKVILKSSSPYLSDSMILK